MNIIIHATGKDCFQTLTNSAGFGKIALTPG